METVDLEFDRVLAERQQYVAGIDLTAPDQPLNTDVLRTELDALWPAANRDDQELYAELLDELKHFGIETTAQLRALISKREKEVLAAEAAYVRQIQEWLAGGKTIGAPDTIDRAKRGLFYTHTGLTRTAMRCEFGEAFDHYQLSQAPFSGR